MLEKIGKIFIFILALAIIIFAFTSFFGLRTDKIPINENQNTVTVIDDTGRTITVKYPVKRIACLASSISETICALDCEEFLVAVDKTSAFPPILEKVVNVGSGTTPNVELLVAQQPDIVFAWYYCDVVDKIEEQSIPVYLVNPKSVNDILNEIEIIGFMLDREKDADQLQSFIEEYVNLISSRTDNLSQNEKPLVYFEFASPNKTGNNETSTHELVSLAGGVNIAADEPVRYPILSSEYIIAENPNVIIKIYYTTHPSFEEEKILEEEISYRPGWHSIEAVEDGKVYCMHWSEASINPRVVIGLLKFAKWFHPELFKDIDIEIVQDNLLRNFYDIEA